MHTKTEQQIGFLQKITKALTESLDQIVIFNSILELLYNELKLGKGTITVLDPGSEQIKIMATHGLTREEQELGIYQLGEGITGEVVRSGHEIIVPDISTDKRFLNKTKARSMHGKSSKTSFLCVPIKLNNQTVGALSADKEFSDIKSLQEDVRLLNIVSAFLAKEIKLQRLMEEDKRKLEAENSRLRGELKEKFKVDNMVGKSNAMEDVYRLVEQVAQSNATVLIRGESGTGKELIANAIHYQSLRAAKPFVKVNCTAIPEALLESELFGYEQGAFTGAENRKPGRFDIAQGGSIFLDEIGDLSMTLQVKILRVIQAKEYERVGGYQPIKANVRIIVATHKNLEEEIKKGNFREDLYYRINVFPIYLPPLRDRKDDIMLLADYFLEKFNEDNNKHITRISTPAIQMLTAYHWPGNVRELENCIERAVLVCNDDVIRSEHLPPSLQIPVQNADPSKVLTMEEMVANREREIIVDALKRTKGNQLQAAKQLSTTQRILGYKIKKYNIEPKLMK